MRSKSSGPIRSTPFWGDGSFGTKNSVKEYLSLFQVVAILISRLEASFGKNSEEDSNGISSTTIERCSLSHLNPDKCSTPKAPEKGIFSRQNAGPFKIYFNWDTHGTGSTLLNSKSGSPRILGFAVQRRHLASASRQQHATYSLALLFVRKLPPPRKKIAQQLAEKREVCRRYRSRRRNPDTTRLARERAPLYAVYEPGTRTLYTDGDMGNALPLLDVILQMDRARDASPSPALPTEAKKPTGKLVGRRSPRY
jgi:hypothetical protein